MKTFSAAVLVVFVVMALFGVFIFATFTTSSSSNIGAVQIWGSLPNSVIDQVFGSVRDTRDDFGGVTYKEVSDDQLVPDLVEAIAAGRGPDLVFFPASSFVKDGEKLADIPYSSIPRRDFQNAFVEAGEIFLKDDGIAALPVIVDPLVLYWNRTLFSNAGVAQPPKYWDDLAAIAPQLTQKTANGSITQSAVALGGWGNIAHGKDILVTLMKQLGAPVVELGPNKTYQTSLTFTTSTGVAPGLSAVRYYVDFADPVKPNYSWNRSQKNSRDAFLAGTLAMYIAPASELMGIRAANPNLNFDVASLPTSRGAGSGVAARVVGLAVPRGAPNPNGAATVATILAGPTVQKFLADTLHLPTARRDVEVDASADQYLTVFRASALRAFAFLDPNPPASDLTFGRMIENIASGRSTLSEAVRDASDELQQLLKMQ